MEFKEAGEENCIVRIQYVIGNLGSGGKERRLSELISYLVEKDGYEVMIVLYRDMIHYPILETGRVKRKVLKTKSVIDMFLLFYQLFRVSKEYQPDIIHTWGYKYTFIAIFSKLALRVPLINGQITSAPPKESLKWIELFVNRVNYFFSDIIISNSFAGLTSFSAPRNKSKVVYNGMDLTRFENPVDPDIIKEKYEIRTRYSVVMVAAFSPKKDYDRFVRIARLVMTLRTDVSFVCVGSGRGDDTIFERIRVAAQSLPLLILTGSISDVESLIHACDIGVLFSPFGEGISNAILEYMAMGKPVIANDAGGTREIVRDNDTGFLIRGESDEEIAGVICDLIDAPALRAKLGDNGKKLICNSFSRERMGAEFIDIYHQLLSK